METVSVIIPVYNGVPFLLKGITSILQQTYNDIEIIIVNDGSTDESRQIIYDLKRQHGDMIQYIEQQNAGIAMARNRGLEQAHGTYVMFMDQDDWLEVDCVEKLVTKMEEDQADIVIGGFYLVESGGHIVEQWKLDEQDEWSLLKITSPWGRLFRREVIQKYDINFLNTKISEDLYFNFLFLSYAKKVSVVSYIGYCWLKNQKSESRTKWNIASKDRDPIQMLEALHENMKVPNPIKYEMRRYFFAKYIVWYLLYIAKRTKHVEMKNIYKRCFQWLEENYLDGKIHLFRPKSEKKSTYSIVWICLMLYKLHIFRLFLLIYSYI